MAKKKAAKKKKETGAVSPGEEILDLARAHLLQKGRAFVVAFENDAGTMEVCMFAPNSKECLGLSGLVTLHAQGIALARNPGFQEHVKRAAEVSAKVHNSGR